MNPQKYAQMSPIQKSDYVALLSAKHVAVVCKELDALGMMQLRTRVKEAGCYNRAQLESQMVNALVDAELVALSIVLPVCETNQFPLYLKESDEMSKLQDAISAQGKFLSGLAIGDMVLVCRDDGEVAAKGTVSYKSDEKTIYLRDVDGLHYRDCRFSRKTGKQHGGNLVLRPFNETLYQARLAEQEALRERYEQRRQAERRARRDGYKAAILADADMIDDENLDGLSDSDLHSLMTILNKLGD